MSKEEVERCVWLLAEDVAKGSGFVEMIRTGGGGGENGMVVVVIEAARMPVDLGRRIVEAIAGCA